MPFITFTDGSANLPTRLCEGIEILACNYTMDGESVVYDGDLDRFDAHAYYDLLRAGKQVHTSLLNAYQFLTAFRDALKTGADVVYVSMSSAISGTFQAARTAAQELMEEFPERLVHIIDSKTCGLGTGLQALRSAELGKSGLSVTDAVRILEQEAEQVCSYFTVDDLNFLKHTGRVSGPAAAIATVLNIKPILYGSAAGRIESCAKVRGRKKSIEALVEKYLEKVTNAEHQTVFISHGDCPEDAGQLAEKICAAKKPKEIVICPHEPFSGAHVGPGMLGLFFRGTER